MKTMNTPGSIWATRPHRLPRSQGGNGILGGVCAGFGARFQIDPVIVRLVFIVTSLAFGDGFFIYLLCWLNMPRYGLALSPWQSLQAHRKELTESERNERATAVAICIAIGIVFPGLIVLGKLWAALLSALILATGWYLAYTRQPLPPAALGSAGSVPKAPGGRKRIWIPATIILAVLSVAATAKFQSHWFIAKDDDPLHDVKVFAGPVVVDLTDIDPLDEDAAIEVRNTFGRVDLRLPKNVPVQVTCDSVAGEIDCPADELNSDAKGHRLTVDVRQRFGYIRAYFVE